MTGSILLPMPKKERSSFARSVSRWVGLILAGLVIFSILQVVSMRFLNPPTTPLTAYHRLRGKERTFHWLPLSKISPFLQQAVIAAEDQLFLSHRGFDWKQIEEALQEYRERGRRRGASTITMQVARNLYLWQGRSWLRKGLEAYYTALIELIWPKWRIMEVYLNMAEWGPGIVGAEVAARRYFGCSAGALTKQQAALLAAVLPNPHRWSPGHPTRYIRERQATILRQMNWFAPLMKTLHDNG